MAFVKTNVSKGHEYYTITESYRENGKIKHRKLYYIGDKEALKAYALKGYLFMKNYEEGKLPDKNKPPPDENAEDLVRSLKTFSHGATASLLWTAELLDVQDILDDVLTGKTVKGLSRSTVLTLASIQRAVKPASKRAFADWADGTSLPYMVGFDAQDLTSQDFWEAMDGISEDELQKCWARIVQKIVNLFDLDISTFHLDYTNYFTWISSKNKRSLICHRGHNKQKRDDLRQFCLAALTAMELQIPIVWEMYPGNTNDKSEFEEFVKLVHEQLPNCGLQTSDITIIFDGGSNSEDNFNDLCFDYICAHSLTGIKNLYDIDLSEYKRYSLSNGKERLGYFLDELEFSGQKGSGILTYSQDLRDGKVAEMHKDIDKAMKAISEMNDRLLNPKSRIFSTLEKERKEFVKIQQEAIEYNRELERQQRKEQESGDSTEKKRKGAPKKPKEIPVWNMGTSLKAILENYVFQGRKYLKHFSSIILKEISGVYQVSMSVNETLKGAYIDKYYGKKLTVTSHTNWTAEQILEQYGGQECIENSVFRDSKNTDHYAVRPQYHYTDDKILVHVFCTMLGLAMGEVLRKLLQAEGCSLTKVALMSELEKIRDGWIVLSDMKSALRVLEDMDEDQQKIWNCILKIFQIPASALRQAPKFRRKAKRHRTRQKKSVASPDHQQNLQSSEIELDDIAS